MRRSDSHAGMQVLEVLYGWCETFIQSNYWFPTQEGARFSNVRAALFGIVFGQGMKNDFRAHASEPLDVPRKFEDGHLGGIADVDRVAFLGKHETVDAFDQVTHVTETASLRSIAINGERLSAQGLIEEGGNHAPVIQLHARPVGIEDPDDVGRHPVFA